MVSQLFIGPSGCGKGTQAGFLVERNGYHHVECSALLTARRTIDPVFNERAKVMDVGVFLDDSDIIETHDLYFRDNPEVLERDIVFDGSIRSIAQATWLIRTLLAHGQDCYVTFFRLPVSECHRRMEIRIEKKMEQGKPVRADDLDPEIRDLRIKQYHERQEEIWRLIAYRFPEIPIIGIDATKSREEIYSEIITLHGIPYDAQTV